MNVRVTLTAAIVELCEKPATARTGAALASVFAMTISLAPSLADIVTAINLGDPDVFKYTCPSARILVESPCVDTTVLATGLLIFKEVLLLAQDVRSGRNSYCRVPTCVDCPVRIPVVSVRTPGSVQDNTLAYCCRVSFRQPDNRRRGVSKCYRSTAVVRRHNQDAGIGYYVGAVLAFNVQHFRPLLCLLCLAWPSKALHRTAYLRRHAPVYHGSRPDIQLHSKRSCHIDYIELSLLTPYDLRGS